MKLLELSQINFLAKNSPDVKRALVTIILMTVMMTITLSQNWRSSNPNILKTINFGHLNVNCIKDKFESVPEIIKNNLIFFDSSCKNAQLNILEYL